MSRDDLADISPAPKKQGRGFTRVWGVAHVVAWGLLLLLLGFVVPRVEVIFKDFNVDLPGVTVLVIRASRLFYLLAAALPVLLGIAWFLLNALDERGEVRSSRAWSILLFVGPLLLIVLSLLTLVLPLMAITTGLRG